MRKDVLAALEKKKMLADIITREPNLFGRQARERMAAAGCKVSLAWVFSHIQEARGLEKKEQSTKKSHQESIQRVLLPQADSVHVAVQMLHRAMVQRRVKKVTVHDTGDVQIESVETLKV